MITRYTRPRMAQLWSASHRLEVWLQVELAVCTAMEELDEIPVGTALAIKEKVAGKLSPQRVEEIEQHTRHDVIAFLAHVEELVGEPTRWLHLGMTSSDLLDTSLALLVREALELIRDNVEKLRGICVTRAEEHRHTPMVGRTHGIHAEPTTLGLTFLRWAAELARAQERIAQALDHISVGKIAGAVGNYAHLSPTVEQRALEMIGLVPETVATQVVGRDRHAEVLAVLALLGGAMEQMAITIRHWQRTEVGEAEEPFEDGQKGSSAMPHKKNPILSENLTGLARMLRAYAGAGLENIALWHERDISHSSVERIVLPDATTLADFMVARMHSLIAGLVVHPARMRKNLERTSGLIFSEAVLLALVRKGLPRQRAYELVQKNALRAMEEQGRFMDLLKKDREVGKVLSHVELESLFEVEHHLRFVDDIFKRALESKRG